MGECPVCGGNIEQNTNRPKKYCSRDCSFVANRMTNIFSKYTREGGSSFKDDSEYLAGSYLYAKAKLAMIERVMEEKGYDCPDFEGVMETHEMPSVEQINIEK